MSEVQSVEVSRPELESGARDLIGDIYDRRLDLALVRGALSASVAASAAARVAATSVSWPRPNAGFDGIDLRVLGGFASPCATAPLGLSPGEYAAADERDGAAVDALFAGTDPPAALFAALLGLAAGGRAAERPVTVGGRSLAPCNVRSLPPGQGLLVHHDDHYRLPIYDSLATPLDRAGCISFFVVLQAAEEGGELSLFALDRDVEEAPMVGGRVDAAAIERTIARRSFAPAAGDLVLFGSGRRYHKVELVTGSRPRLTAGGFLAFEEGRDRIMFWG